MDRVLKAIAVVGFWLFTTTLFAQPVQLNAVQFQTTSGHPRFILRVSSTVVHRIFSLEGPDRLVIDLADTRLKGELSQPPASHPLIKRIRSAPRYGNDLRVVLDLKGPVHPRSFLLHSKPVGDHQLIIDLFRQASLRPASHPTGKSVGRAVSKAKPAPKRTIRREGNVVIAIDAGHGGEDPGARGARGTKEKDVVLTIARRLEALIRQQPGMRPVMIRNGDYFLSLRQRMRLAREAKADLFISIHADAFKERDVRGSSVYTLSERGASSEAARWLAARENAADLVGGVSLDDKDDLLASVLLDLSQTATREASQEVAGRVLSHLQRIGRLHKRRVQRAGFVVLKSPDVPSILVETAFISNPREELILGNRTHQAQLAKAMFLGIREYFASSGRPLERVATREP
jgi:N-acetylmuramoyl-L-alanine amidase